MLAWLQSPSTVGDVFVVGLLALGVAAFGFVVLVSIVRRH
jgi:hypothetical protein